MSPTSEPPPFSIPHGMFRFRLRVTSRMVLPGYKGGVMRGAFGDALRSVTCKARRKECGGCPLHGECLYVTLFQPAPPPGHPGAGKFSHMPPPYVLTPPLTSRQIFHPGDTLELELVLMGPAEQALPHFVCAFDLLGSRGLGKERGTYRIENVDFINADSSHPSPHDGFDGIHAAHPAPEAHTTPSDESGVNVFRLHFMTPLRIMVEGHLLTRFSFGVFLERLLHRLSLLHSFYGSGEDSPDVLRLVDRAKEITVTKDDARWYDWERYSARQRTAMKLGGLRGTAELRGCLEPFLPALRLGEIFHVGQGTSFGLGKYRLSF